MQAEFFVKVQISEHLTFGSQFLDVRNLDFCLCRIFFGIDGDMFRTQSQHDFFSVEHVRLLCFCKEVFGQRDFERRVGSDKRYIVAFDIDFRVDEIHLRRSYKTCDKHVLRILI